MKDPIVEEVRKHREEILKEYETMHAYNQDIMKRQLEYGDRLVSFPSKKTKTARTVKS